MPPNWATTSRLWPGSSRSNGSIGSVKHPVLFIKEKAPSVRHIYRFAILFLTAHPYFTLASDSPSSPESPLPASETRRIQWLQYYFPSASGPGEPSISQMAEAGDAGGAGVGEWRPVVSRGRGLCSDVVNECFAAEPAVSAGGGGAECGGLEGSGRRSGGSLAERRAARCGFSAPRINTARFRSVSPLASPGVWSPYITIPAGLSPTTLLDSPVMLPSAQV